MGRANHGATFQAYLFQDRVGDMLVKSLRERLDVVEQQQAEASSSQDHRQILQQLLDAAGKLEVSSSCLLGEEGSPIPRSVLVHGEDGAPAPRRVRVQPPRATSSSPRSSSPRSRRSRGPAMAGAVTRRLHRASPRRARQASPSPDLQRDAPRRARHSPLRRSLSPSSAARDRDSGGALFARTSPRTRALRAPVGPPVSLARHSLAAPLAVLIA